MIRWTLFFAAILMPLAVQAQQGTESATGLDDYLALFEITPTTLAEVTDDAKELLDTDAALIRTLEALRRIPAGKLFDWRSSLDASPESNGARVVMLQGRAKKITALPLPPAVRDQFPRDDFFRCELELDQGRTAVCFALEVPRQLLQADESEVEIDQRISATALVATARSADDTPSNQPTIIALSQRLAWHPEEGNKTVVWLANRGVDIGALGEIQPDSALQPEDRLAFYQLLAAARRWEPAQLAPLVDTALSNVATLLKMDQRLSGSAAVTFQGVARRAVPIVVGDDEVADQYGVQRYYEMEIFVELDQPIRIKGEEAERTFQRYPIVFCAATLPDGMPTGDNIQEPVEVTGMFLKNWAYPSAWLAPQQPGKRQLQMSPLIIGQSPKWNVAEPLPPSWLERNGGWLFVAALLILGAIIWRNNVGDQKVRNRRRAQTPPPKFDDLDLN